MIQGLVLRQRGSGSLYLIRTKNFTFCQTIGTYRALLNRPSRSKTKEIATANQNQQQKSITNEVTAKTFELPERRVNAKHQIAFGFNSVFDCSRKWSSFFPGQSQRIKPRQSRITLHTQFKTALYRDKPTRAQHCKLCRRRQKIEGKLENAFDFGLFAPEWLREQQVLQLC